MPARPRPTATYFVTSSTYERWPIFNKPENAVLFLQTLQHYRAEGKYKLHAFVIMPDHIHLLLTPIGITIERAIGLIKGGFSHRLGGKTPIWTTGFHERRMRNEEEFLARREYIHLNPVRARLVASAQEYPFSSAFREPSRSG